jgi:hypothetical protein
MMMSLIVTISECTYHAFTMRAVCPANHILPYLTTVIIFDEVRELWHTPLETLHNFLHRPKSTPSLVSPDMLLSNMFSNVRIFFSATCSKTSGYSSRQHALKRLQSVLSGNHTELNTIQNNIKFWNDLLLGYRAAQSQSRPTFRRFVLPLLSGRLSPCWCTAHLWNVVLLLELYGDISQKAVIITITIFIAWHLSTDLVPYRIRMQEAIFDCQSPTTGAHFWKDPVYTHLLLIWLTYFAFAMFHI